MFYNFGSSDERVLIIITAESLSNINITNILQFHLIIKQILKLTFACLYLKKEEINPDITPTNPH